MASRLIIGIFAESSNIHCYRYGTIISETLVWKVLHVILEILYGILVVNWKIFTYEILAEMYGGCVFCKMKNGRMDCKGKKIAMMRSITIVMMTMMITLVTIEKETEKEVEVEDVYAIAFLFHPVHILITGL